MQTLRTIFRTAVMLAVAVIGYHAWQLYGPSADRLKSFGLRIIESAQSALGESDLSESANPGQASVVPTPPPLAAAAPSAGQVLQAQAVGPTGPPTTSQSAAFEPPALATRLPAASELAADAPAPDADLPALYSRLAELGGVQPQLAAWGNDGRLYRFCCRAAAGRSSGFQRQFEAIAAEPHLAVAEVIAKLEAWRGAEQTTADRGSLVRK